MPQMVFGERHYSARSAPGSVRSTRWHLINNSREGAKRRDLYVVQHSKIVKAMDAADDNWWAEVLPQMENENAARPAVNPCHEQY